MQSPRRSPRISAESPKRQSPRFSGQNAVSKKISAGKGRASTGALRADKENEPIVSPRAKKTKTVRRAYSVGGELLRKTAVEKDNTISSVPSRRNVPGPRKSAIRALPPQVFDSPTNALPPVQIRSAFASHSSDSLSAFGGSELMDLINSVAPVRNTQKQSEMQLKHKQRSSMPSASQNKAPTLVVTELNAEEDDNTTARKKRRVTFNPYQERTDFHLEEPTIRIRPSGEAEFVTAGNSTGSHDSSDMSLDSEDSGLQSVDESSMDITASYSEPKSLLEASMMSDDSAMELTTAYGGVLDGTRTAALLPSGQEEVDEDSESEQDSSSDDEQATLHDDKDMTVTMQFTSVYGADGADDSESQMEQSRDMVMQQENDSEVDMQLTEVDDESIGEEQNETVDMGEEEDSAMEMTDIYSPSKEIATPKKARSSTAHSVLSSPDRQMASSPRLGHEYCKIPAADSPKHNLSAASLKAQARRQSMSSQSPVKTSTLISKSSLGKVNASPFKAPFHASTAEIDKSRNRQSMPSKASPSPMPHSPSPPRHSSPAKSPTTPSRVWKGFRRSQGGADSPPAKRVSVGPQSPSKGGFGSPQRIAIKTKAVPLASKAEKVVQDEEKWTMKHFFDSLDLGFLELSMPSKRRVDRGERDDRLEADSAALIKAACAHLPFLDSLVGACEELKSTVVDGRTIALEDENAFFIDPPLYVAEVASMTSNADRQRAISAFRIQKAAARANALQAYYAWRTDRQFSDSSLQKWENIRSKLEDDVQYVTEASKLVREEMMPVLQSRHRHLLQQVEMERKRQSALDKCDDEEMNELHRAMEEQGSVLTEQQTLVKEAKEELERVQLQVKQVAARQRVAEEATERAQSSYESIAICTKEEATRLERQTKHLETLHLWTLRRASMSEIVLELEGCLSLTLMLQKAAVSSALIQISRGGAIWQDTLQQTLEDRLSLTQGEGVQPADLVRFVTTAWTRIRHFYTVYESLLARFPAEMQSYTHDKGSGVVVRASVLLPRRRSKVIVEAKCGMARLIDIKLPLFELEDISATCVYGSVDAPAIAAQIADCVTMGSSAGDLTKAISEALDTFD